MKISKISFVFILAVSFLLLANFSTNKDLITVNVKIINNQNVPFEKGILRVIETGETFEITEIKDFTIQLKKGKYKFDFQSETSHIVKYQPKIKPNNDNTITIELFDGKTSTFNSIYVNEENWEQKLENNELQFITFGIAAKSYPEFKEKYGINVYTDNCVITPFQSQKAKENNQIIADYLTERFGDVWKEDLGFMPYGLE